MIDHQVRETSESNTSPGGVSRWCPPLVVVVIAMVVMYPWITWGVVPAHDRQTHLYYFHGFYEQLRAGEAYPRWLASANFGAGSPVFFVQYPLPFFVASAFHYLLRLPANASGESHALAAVFVLSAILLGLGLFLWCSRFANRWIAAIAAVAGLTSPYILSMDFYTRAAIGECMALACIAFALYFCHDLALRPVRASCGIALSVCALFLSHLLSVIIFVPLLVGYATCVAPSGRIRRSLTLLGIAIGFAAAMSSVYLLPILTYNRYFELSGLMRQANGVFNYDNQLIPLTESIKDGFPSGWWFLKWVIWAVSVFSLFTILLQRGSIRAAGAATRAIAVIILLLIVVSTLGPLLGATSLLSHSDPAEEWIHVARSHFFGFAFLTIQLLFLAFLATNQRPSSNRIGLFLIAASLTSYLMMTRWTAAIWHHAHFLWSLQFPWRFFGLLSVFGVGLLALWFEAGFQSRRFLRFAVVGAVPLIGLAAMGVVGWQAIPKFAHHVHDDSEAKFDMALPTYLHSPELYGSLNPFQGDAAEFATSLVRGDGAASYQQLTSRRGLLVADCKTSCAVQLHLVYFPPWKATTTDGTELPLNPSARTGFTVVELPAGSHRIGLELPKSASERIGACLSSLSLLTLCAAYFGFKRFDQPVA